MTVNTGIIILIVLAAIALLVFIVLKNHKDRKKLFPPDGTDDSVEVKRMDQHREKDKL